MNVPIAVPITEKNNIAPFSEKSLLFGLQSLISAITIADIVINRTISIQ
jgi:hypothetical protein